MTNGEKTFYLIVKMLRFLKTWGFQLNKDDIQPHNLSLKFLRIRCVILYLIELDRKNNNNKNNNRLKNKKAGINSCWIIVELDCTSYNVNKSIFLFGTNKNNFGLKPGLKWFKAKHINKIIFVYFAIALIQHILSFNLLTFHQIRTLYYSPYSRSVHICVIYMHFVSNSFWNWIQPLIELLLRVHWKDTTASTVCDARETFFFF